MPSPTAWTGGDLGSAEVGTLSGRRANAANERQTTAFAREPKPARLRGDVRPLKTGPTSPGPLRTVANNALRRENKIWWARQDSNLEPDGYEPSALTIELRAPPEQAS